MKRNTVVIITLVTCIMLKLSNCEFPNVYKKLKQVDFAGDPGDPLILTTLINQTRIEEAQAAAKVNSSLFLNVESYAGYFTVNEQYNSNLFFWFFSSENDYLNDPIVLWLQGGPGATSLYGLFEENGPFSVDNDANLHLRQYSWTKSFSVLYIDNPVGTGYSFTSNGYAQNETKVASDLYSALVQFFTLFPELQQREFYIAGESYGGKYVPSIAYKISKENPDAALKINLQGIAIGNGLTDPIHQFNYGDYLFQLGLIDSNTRELFKENEKEVVDLIQKGEYLAANRALDLTKGESLFYKATGFYNINNYLKSRVEPDNEQGMAMFIQSTEIRSAIHVGSTMFDGEPIYHYLESDIMQSVAPWVSELLSKYRVLFYNGQLDIIVAYPMTVNFLQKLEFDGSEEYKKAERHVWRVDNEVAGYVKQAGNLTEVLVRNAGHMVPAEQPKWAYHLMEKFVKNQPLYDIVTDMAWTK